MTGRSVNDESRTNAPLALAGLDEALVDGLLEGLLRAVVAHARLLIVHRARTERERLKQLLRERLIECGWRDELKERYKRVVKERGFENVTADELAREIAPLGRATVPDAVKAELLKNIRTFLK